MKQTLLAVFCLFLVYSSPAQQLPGYTALDSNNPVLFAGKYIQYKGKKITLGPKAFFIDGQLSDAEAARYPFVFNSVNKAAEHLSHGSETDPMVLYLAPYVYWIDNPDDPAIRVSEDGGPPYGLVINCEWLRFYGLTDNAEHVVLASNRGQTIGAVGNFTMFKFIGQGTSSENVTFGNYCNIDLDYKLKPALSREKRATAIVQAQLIHCNGDKIVARNTRFVSRLNLNPFVGGKRVLFDRCHFESTDDALCGTAVYLNSTLEFYASKPFYHTTGTGAVFLNCDIRSFTRGRQYFTKANGQVAVVDTRFSTDENTYLGWRDVVPPQTRNYQFQVIQNGKQVQIGKEDPAATVAMAGKPVLAAYRVEHQGNVIYNTYNLLRGDDDWDPMGVKQLIRAAEKEQNKALTMLPVQLLLSPATAKIETGKNQARLTARVLRFGNYSSESDKITWAVAPEFAALVQLQVSEDGKYCDVIPTNKQDTTRQVLITAVTASGLEAAAELTVAPAILKAPAFTRLPVISKPKKGFAEVTYNLDMTYADQSEVSWFRCTDARGSNPVEVAVSRMNKPLLRYALTAGDVGYYLMVQVVPKHIRSEKGETASYVMPQPVKAREVTADKKVLYTDFRNISTRNQPKVIPGFWTLDHFRQTTSAQTPFTATDNPAWYYGEGSDGAAAFTGLLQGRSATLFYTPTGSNYGDMQLTLTVAPFKTAGQGFSVAHLYMDVLVKFDPATMTGYGLRFIRTTNYHDAVECVFVKYENGAVTAISEPVPTTAYKTPCRISIEVKGNRMKATAVSGKENRETPARLGVVAEVDMATDILPNSYGGFGIQYNGGAPTLLQELQVAWK